jgi:hypothetical protein
MIATVSLPDVITNLTRVDNFEIDPVRFIPIRFPTEGYLDFGHPSHTIDTYEGFIGACITRELSRIPEEDEEHFETDDITYIYSTDRYNQIAPMIQNSIRPFRPEQPAYQWNTFVRVSNSGNLETYRVTWRDFLVGDLNMAMLALAHSTAVKVSDALERGCSLEHPWTPSYIDAYCGGSPNFVKTFDTNSIICDFHYST